MIVNLYHWSSLELRQVVALQTVVEAGSFWLAADRLDTSQSALSQQIAALEHVVGARLIERSRGRRSIALTEAGEIFLRHAAAIVARLSAAHPPCSTAPWDPCARGRGLGAAPCACPAGHACGAATRRADTTAAPACG